MLTIESFFTSSHFFGPLRTIIDMTTSSPPASCKPSPPPTQTSQENVKESMPSSRRRPRRRQTARPEPGSLNAIMREHSGTSLYVQPICWTDAHAQLLGARFVELDSIRKPVPGPKHCGWDAYRPSQTATALGHELTTLLAAESDVRWYLKMRAIKAVLSTMFPTALSRSKSNAELDIYFGGRVFRKAVRVPVLWRHPEYSGTSFDSAVTRPANSFDKSSTSCRESSSLSGSIGGTQPTPNQPLLAYINRKQLSAIRHHLYRISPGPSDGDRFNTPVTCLQQLRSKQLIPAVDDHDAHYVAILLAMAQARFYNKPSSKPSSQSSSQSGRSSKSIEVLPNSFSDVKVQLITHDDAAAEFVVYTANVTAVFLERFAQPNTAPARPTTSAGEEGEDDFDSGLEISYVRVPIWPILGLKERLGKALGREIAGDTAIFEDSEASDNIETWHSHEERRHIQRYRQRITSLGTKRRRGVDDRGVLAEMVNSSFEVDDDAASCASDDMPVLSPDTKRRCTRTVKTLEVC